MRNTAQCARNFGPCAFSRLFQQPQPETDSARFLRLRPVGELSPSGQLVEQRVPVGKGNLAGREPVDDVPEHADIGRSPVQRGHRFLTVSEIAVAVVFDPSACDASVDLGPCAVARPGVSGRG